MIKVIVVLIALFFIGCSNYGQLTFITKLPKKLDENSGIVSLENSKIWLIEDRGNTDHIYEVNFEGDLLKEYKVKNAKNRDWEDLTSDEVGNVYIGDFGNNSNKRRDLTIYKIPNPSLVPGDKIAAEAIRLSYPEQKEFPPKAENFSYDAEAMFYRKGYLYIITKNRATPFNGKALVYSVPARPGVHQAQLIGTITTCEEPRTCIVTSAAISPDGKKVVLLGYGKLWIFTDFEKDDFTKGKMKTIDLGATTQLESVCFMDDTTLLLSDEASHGTGGNLYSFELNK